MFLTFKMQLLIVIFGILAFAKVQTAEARCMTASDCNPDECCAKQTGPLIMSKRDQMDLGLIQPSGDIYGTCRKYNLEGEHCNIFDKPNGFCGCATGLTCIYVRTGIRSPPAFPGYFHCARK
ncbi:uncharacterized protein LOC121378357 [Gigantopelta aegis]|uniref:uncharacterized protein LOC121378357 n=1 Tax=Gigantopelta aegis TaxID=1735272 RepID=UPI001B88AC4E|nr:uncharacterized protein LOC121378357 [Gigantopelta aegis]